MPKQKSSLYHFASSICSNKILLSLFSHPLILHSTLLMLWDSHSKQTSLVWLLSLIWIFSIQMYLLSFRSVVPFFFKIRINDLGATVPLIVKICNLRRTKIALVLNWLILFTNTFCTNIWFQKIPRTFVHPNFFQTGSYWPPAITWAEIQDEISNMYRLKMDIFNILLL